MNRVIERVLIIVTVVYFAGVVMLFAFDYFPQGGEVSISEPAVAASHALTDGIVEDPVILKIPRLSINAAVIQPVGLTPEGDIGTPTNYHDVAWFTGSPRPGNSGNSVIVGHRDTRLFAPGVFRALKNLEIGDDVFVESMGGHELHFRVVDKKVYYENTDRLFEIVGPTSRNRLNLITCTGTWDQAIKRYDQRLVVFTELVE